MACSWNRIAVALLAPATAQEERARAAGAQAGLDVTQRVQARVAQSLEEAQARCAGERVGRRIGGRQGGWLTYSHPGGSSGFTEAERVGGRRAEREGGR